MNKNIKYTRTYIKNKLANNIFEHYSDQFKQIYNLLQRTIENGESNSALLIGQRGTGKTTLIEKVINELHTKLKVTEDAFFIKLHGLIHTEDHLALKAITAQMNLENVVDGKVFGSFAENLAFLLACLKTGKRNTTKSVIIILEEFDLFCAHHNQTLLYNLFDVSQSAQTPLSIIGITCRLDVIELLEKRVKSRFSHRQIFLFNGQPEQAIITDLEICLSKIKEYLSFTSCVKTDLSVSYKNQWNKNIQDLIDNKKFVVLISRLIDIDTNEKTIKNMLMMIVSTLNDNKPTITLEDFVCQINNLEKDEMLDTLQDLSVLEMCLLIAMKHHYDIYDNQVMNFEMIFNRYVKFANSHSNIQNVQRPVLMKAFEHIQYLELILPVSQGGGKLQKEYQMFKLLVHPQLIIEAVNRYSGMPTEVVHWSRSSIA